MLDVSPSVAADILGDRLPARVARAYRRFRHGPGAFKVDFAVEEGVSRGPLDAARRGRHGPSRWRSRRSRRQRDGGAPGRDARAAVRARRPAVPRRPGPVGRQHPPACGRMPTYPTRTPATRPMRSSPRSSGSPPASGSGSSARRCAPPRRCRCTTANYVGGDVIGGASSLDPDSCSDHGSRVDPYFTGVAGHVPVLGVDAARGRRPRDVRRQRRRSRPGRSGPGDVGEHRPMRNAADDSVMLAPIGRPSPHSSRHSPRHARPEPTTV